MQNRIAFVTGASRGIGRACALALSKGGARVVVAARQVDKLEHVAAEIRSGGGDAFVVPIDMSAPDSIRSAFDKSAKEFGRIDILVNNAAITRDGLAMRMKQADWDHILQTDLTSAFHTTKAVMSGMLRARWGRIVNMTSVVGITGNPGQANYAAAKAGLIGLTKSLAQEMGSRGITVNAIAPGFVETDMTQGLSQELKDKMLGAIPLKRFGQPDDVAAAVRFLASEAAGYITGHVLNVNGGMYM